MSITRASSARASAEVYTHKFFTPPVYAGVIRRDQLIERSFGQDARVVLLQGPAGHGKSTALQQIKSVCDERGQLTGWLTLDDADNDTRRFYLHIHALLKSLKLSDRKPDERDGGRRRSDWLLERLQRAGKPVALFFDDFQMLNNRSILTFFRELFERLPENLHFYIGTRSTPEMGLTRLVVNQRALILHADDLRFSPAEVERFFAGGARTEISADEISAIYRRTEGWPAALQLFRLSLASPDVRRSLDDFTSSRPRELAEYLADNVLALQTPEVRDFLLRTAPLPRLTASLCHAVTGRVDSQELLLQLERSGLFVPSLDTDLRWFKYHALFASFLAEQLQNDLPEAALDVHRKAAQWHLARGNSEETLLHAVASRDFALAADTLECWASQLIGDAMLITMERWYDELPFEEVAKRPGLLVRAAWAMVFLHRRAKLKPLRQLLEARAAAGEADANVVLSMAAISDDDVGGSQALAQRVKLHGQEPEGFAAFELGAACNLTAYHALGASDFAGARELLGLARANNARGISTFSRGYTVALVGTSLLLQGQLHESLAAFEAGAAEERMQAEQSFASAALVSCHIWALYEANQLDRAEALFGQHHDIIVEAGLMDFLALAYLAMVRIHDARGRAGKALEILDEAEAVGHTHGWERLLRLVNWERVRRALVTGAIERAHATAALNPPSPPTPERIMFSEDAEGEALCRIRLAIQRMDFDAAANKLAAEQARCRGRDYRQIKLHLLEAALHQARDEGNAAHRSLRKALALAAPGGFVRCFLDEGDAVLQLLREEYQGLLEADDDITPVRQRAHIESLLQASGTDLSRARSTREAQPVEPLTDREKEILVFLANGVSNKEMAARLFVSENTIKFHLKNIYSKLAVGSRVQAITTGRKLGLVG